MTLASSQPTDDETPALEPISQGTDAIVPTPQRVQVERLTIDAGPDDAGTDDAGPGDAGAEDVERVVAVRSEADDPATLIGERAVSVMGSGAKIFFQTVKRMMILAVVLGLAAAWYAENDMVLRGIAAFGLVFLSTAAAGVMLAGQRAVAAVSVETWRQTGLVTYMMNMLLDQVAGVGAPATQGDAATPAPPPSLSLPEAKSRLSVATTEWIEDSARQSPLPGVLRTAQKWLAELVQQIIVAEFKVQAKAAGSIRVPAVREAMAGRAADLIAVRVRSRMRRSIAGTLAAVLVLAVAIAYAVARVG